MIQTHTFLPVKDLPKNIIFPQQSHGNRVVKIVTGEEDLSACDGLWTTNPDFLLGVKTADCAPICVWNQNQFGVLHTGWRGTVNGAIENLLAQFETGRQTSPNRRDRSLNFKIWVGPILPRFEIQKDNCYQQIYDKFGDRFFTKPPSSSPQRGEGLQFEFKKCLQFMLPQAQFDPRSTLEDSTLASWRRDKAFPNGQNSTVIGPTNLF